MLDPDCFGEPGSPRVLTEENVEFICELMEEQRFGPTPISGPALDVVVPAVIREQISVAGPDARRLSNRFLFTCTTPLNDNAVEAIDRQSTRKAARGNALSNKHDADADALFETMKCLFDVFVTNDVRLTKRATELGFAVLSPSQMMASLEGDSWPSS